MRFFWMPLMMATCLAIPVRGDEGMWLFNDLPVQLLKERYDFQPSDAWARRIMLSSVRFNSGGSGSFVSSGGLVLTNHHVASDTLHKLSSPERDLIQNGFLARTPEEELKAPDLELNQLVEIVDVSERVQAAVGESLPPEEAAKARRAVLAQIEKESFDETGLRSDVVTLFGGAQYHLYRYKKFTDVRLVWAPETKIAFFGGDADNFEYPRYCLDATLFRVYEDGKPAHLEHFLEFSPDRIERDQLVFVSGHPGRTQRIFTVAALEYLRDHRLPYVLDYLRRKEILLQQFGLAGEEASRRARDELFGIQNARKAYGGMLRGLLDPAVFEQKNARQEEILAALPPGEDARQPWKRIAELQQEKLGILKEVTSLRSRLYQIAEQLVLLAAEDQKPNAERLPEFRESSRESFLQDLLSEAPIYDDLEQVKLADELARMAELRGGDDPLVVKVYQGKAPRERAAELVAGTKLADVAERKRLVQGGAEAVAASDDPLIQLAKTLEPEYREVRSTRERIEEEERQAYTKVSNAIVAVEGTGTYPDATFTLRLAFGTIRGYVEDGKPIPPWTTMGEIFSYAQAHAEQEDYELPSSWIQAREKIDGETPFNFVSTADIIGGNSGSPVVDREARLVGLIFDGNIQSLTSDYLYTDAQARAVSVTSSSIIEALRSIYAAPELAEQLGN